MAPRLPLLLGALVGMVTAGVPVVLHIGLGLPDAALLARVGAVAVALGAGFALDDPAARTTVSVPVSRLLVRAVRALPVLVACAVVWVTVAVLARATVDPQARALFPWGGLALEAAALVAGALGLAALGLRFTDGEHGAATAVPGVLLLVVTAVLLPERAALFLPPGHPDWTATHRIWAVLLLAGLSASALPVGRWRLRRPGGEGRRRAPGGRGRLS
ncbi:ABC transporter [Streptomyces sp. CBMA156]|uniref:ABC transporter n=1 Tax=Streptomyces sp. CBMA156 TaxID=1930280 RepID=UPI001661BE19|nr:ABC transporter [Streptomyces sp. CBMA156]MBD0671951.1 hypothetical protein [Streptomyces sp. CBMA156]